MFCDITYGSRVARRNRGRGRIQEPFLTRRERSSLGGIKSNQNHAALSPFRSRKIQPLHIPDHRPSSANFPLPPLSLSLFFRFSSSRREERAEAWPLSSSQHPSPVPWECARDQRTGPEDANQIHGEGREKKVWISACPGARKFLYVDSVWESRSNRA